MSVNPTKQAGEFHKVNIHEKNRWAPAVCRMTPLLFTTSVFVLAMVATFKDHQWLLLRMTAFFNVCLWLWSVSTILLCIYATQFKMVDLERCPKTRTSTSPCVELAPETNSISTKEENGCVVSIDGVGAGCDTDGTGGTSSDGNYGVRHVIVLPNYKEDEAMLQETLSSLTECEDSNTFFVVLGMEEREGDVARQKAERLQKSFASQFADILFCIHPSGQMEHHLDGSSSPEVPGKASNLKFAVDFALKECEQNDYDIDRLLLTVADADCIFHPCYFGEVGMDFLRHGSTRTMWQAPQLAYRNYWKTPIVSRVWAYVATCYECGGLASTDAHWAFGRHHMLFSSYTMPLKLARDAEAWDGDVICEDHHAYLKCYYYALQSRHREGGISVRPVFLPVKSTSIHCEEDQKSIVGSWKSWLDRWHQAKRHAQGVAEFSYALLATHDALQTLPAHRKLDIGLLAGMMQVIVRLFCMHLLPVCQTICLGFLTVKWFWHNRIIDDCPDKLHFVNLIEEEYLLCGLAGAWVLIWPVVVPFFLIILANFLILHHCFIRPATLNPHGYIWHADDLKAPCGTSWLYSRIFAGLVLESIFGMSWILIPYGFIVGIIGQINVAFYGNQFAYVTASKGACSRRSDREKISGSGYGTMWDSKGRDTSSLAGNMAVPASEFEPHSA